MVMKGAGVDRGDARAPPRAGRRRSRRPRDGHGERRSQAGDISKRERGGPRRDPRRAPAPGGRGRRASSKLVRLASASAFPFVLRSERLRARARRRTRSPSRAPLPSRPRARGAEARGRRREPDRGPCRRDGRCRPSSRALHRARGASTPRCRPARRAGLEADCVPPARPPRRDNRPASGSASRPRPRSAGLRLRSVDPDDAPFEGTQGSTRPEACRACASRASSADPQPLCA